MWKTPYKSANTTGAFTTPQEAEFEFDDDQFPECIASNSRYMKLYRQFKSQSEKVYESIQMEAKQKEQNSINKAITETIVHIKHKNQFQKKFSETKPRRMRRTLSNKFKGAIGLTSLEMKENKLGTFFTDIDRTFQLDEKKRLIEFYLRDFKTENHKVDFIDKIQLNNRYRRISVPKSGKRQTDLYHNERQYMNCIKTAYLKNDHLIQNAVETSSKNPAYLRKKNFERKVYISNKINNSLIINRKIIENPQRQKKLNLLKRCFIQIAECSQSRRIYYEYISTKKIGSLFRFLFPDEDKQIISEEVLKALVEKITKHKNRKILQFQDFRELIETLDQKYGYKIESLNDKLENDPNNKFIYKKIEEFKSQNKQQIQKCLQKLKIYTAFISLYDKSPNIIAKKYLPQNYFSAFMKKQGLIPNHITMTKFIGCCEWYMFRQQGFTLKEFMEIQVTLALMMKLQIPSIKTYFKKFNFQEILL